MATGTGTKRQVGWVRVQTGGTHAAAAGTTTTGPVGQSARGSVGVCQQMGVEGGRDASNESDSFGSLDALSASICPVCRRWCVRRATVLQRGEAGRRCDAAQFGSAERPTPRDATGRSSPQNGLEVTETKEVKGRKGENGEKELRIYGATLYLILL